MRFLKFLKLNKHRLPKRIVSTLTIWVLFLYSFLSNSFTATAATEEERINGAALLVRGYEFIILSSYEERIKIGETKLIVAMSTIGAELTYKSSNSSVASVNMYGEVTGKKAGKAKITAKSKGAEASCDITVERTSISLNAKTLTLENGATYRMTAKTSTGAPVEWKSSKQSVAIISDSGVINAIRPGTTTITATADGSKETCILTVKRPDISLSANKIKMYKGKTAKLYATVSSGKDVVWRSSKTSVVTVDETGKLYAVKHGQARISASLDGITRYCAVTVASPVIRLNKTSVKLKKGQKFKLKADVSSGNNPTFKCSSTKVASVSASGKIKAKKKGSCTVSVSEDGTTVKCKVKVTDK